jgi:adenylate kinase
VGTYLAAGRLVPDEVIVAMIRHRLEAPKADAGFVLDGYPRTVAQARALRDVLGNLDRPLDLAMVLDVPTEELIQRLSTRAKLEDRDDDTLEVIEERLRVYHDQTEPVLDYRADFVQVARIDGTKPVDEVSQEILQAIG